MVRTAPRQADFPRDPVSGGAQVGEDAGIPVRQADPAKDLPDAAVLAVLRVDLLGEVSDVGGRNRAPPLFQNPEDFLSLPLRHTHNFRHAGYSDPNHGFSDTDSCKYGGGYQRRNRELPKQSGRDAFGRDLRLEWKCFIQR